MAKSITVSVLWPTVKGANLRAALYHLLVSIRSFSASNCAPHREGKSMGGPSIFNLVNRNR